VNGHVADLFGFERPYRSAPPPELVPIERGRRYPYEPTDLEGAFQILRELGADGGWMDWSEICEATRMYPSDVSAFLTALADRGHAEKEDRWYCNDPLLAPDGYVVGWKAVDELRRRGICHGFTTVYRWKQ
jgi:hypothetical protein